MLTYSLALLLLRAPAQSEDAAALALLRSANTSLAGRNAEGLESLFQKPEYARYVLEMARRKGGLQQLKAVVIPTPPGWNEESKYWIHFYTDHDIQQDHDTIHPLTESKGKFSIGPELPEWEDGGYSIRFVESSVELNPSTRTAEIETYLDLASTEVAPVFRLGHKYEVTGSVLEAGPDAIPKPSSGDVLRAGGLVIPWKSVSNLRLSYRRTFGEREKDKVIDDVAYLSAWWVPALNRLPAPTQVTIAGPADWVLRSEGEEIPTSEAAKHVGLPSGAQVKAFRCELPISYPKVVAGEYKVAAEKTVGRHTFRSYQLGELDTERGQAIVNRLADGMEFFEKNLGPFPFDGYDVFDGKNYYGIESYSYTLLSIPISLKYATHEMGHTYFGGVVPSAYVRDTWNEGVTTYVDEVLFLHERDTIFQRGLQSINYNVPLSKMHLAYGGGGASYFRGAYAMHMLEQEIGKNAVLTGLRALVKDRVGKETVWGDLRPYFEQASAEDLRWFWEQWIDSADFPRLQITDFQQEAIACRVRVVQSGTEEPYRLRFAIRTTKGELETDTVVTMTEREQVFRLPPADKAEIVVYPHTLATVVK